MAVGIHYRVAFLHEGETRYGIVESHTERATEHARRGELVVLDAVYPQTWFVEERCVQDIPITQNGEDEYFAYILNEHIQAAEESNHANGLKRKLLRFSAGRGRSAYYVITRVAKTLVHLEWRGFDIDRCTADTLGYFGRMDRARAEKLVEHDEWCRRGPEHGPDST